MSSVSSSSLDDRDVRELDREDDMVASALEFARMGDVARATATLAQAARNAASATGAARLWAACAMVEREGHGAGEHVIALLRQSLMAAEDAAANEGGSDVLAGVLLMLGETLLEAATSGGVTTQDADVARLQESVRCHQRAERLFRQRKDAGGAGLCLINTAVAYLSMGGGPSSLKPKIAEQCLRAALAELDPVEHETTWCSAAVNLANVLQQLPVSTDGRELFEAVALYHEVAHRRRVAGDEPGTARAFANLGCLMGKLGRFAEAEENLREALRLFAGDAEAIQGVEATLRELDQARAAANSSDRLRREEQDLGSRCGGGACGCAGREGAEA
ncbi:MAG: tetratricopeptide repeat protein [Planctomycetota bacterium]|nr:tetratricopeptide repeat protein [Planctomycetota bacterium]